MLKYAQKIFSKRKAKVPNVVIYLTNQCNLRCSYCYSGYENEVESEKITFSDIDMIFEAIPIIYKMKSYLDKEPVLSLFGGEPLLPYNRDNIDYIIKKMNNLNYRNLEIVTNLVNISTYIDLLNLFKGEISVRVTLNGDQELHDSMRKSADGTGTYKKTLDNIVLSLKNINRISINLSILINNEIDQQSIDNLFKDLQDYNLLENEKVEIGFGHIQFRSKYICPEFVGKVLDVSDYYPLLYRFKKNNNLINDSMICGSSMYLLNEIYKAKHKDDVVVPNFCGCDAVYPGRYCFFTDGKIYPCFDCVGMKTFDVGSYRGKLYFNDNYKKWSNYSVINLSKCNECKYVAICNGGCLISNISQNGNMNDVFCENVDGAIQKILDYILEEGVQ